MTRWYTCELAFLLFPHEFLAMSGLQCLPLRETSQSRDDRRLRRRPQAPTTTAGTDDDDGRHRPTVSVNRVFRQSKNHKSPPCHGIFQKNFALKRMQFRPQPGRGSAWKHPGQCGASVREQRAESAPGELACRADGNVEPRKDKHGREERRTGCRRETEEECETPLENCTNP